MDVERGIAAGSDGDEDDQQLYGKVGEPLSMSSAVTVLLSWALLFVVILVLWSLFGFMGVLRR